MTSATRRWSVGLLLLLACVFQTTTSAVGTTTVTVTSITDGRHVKYSIAWLSDASGDVNANSAALSVIRPGYLKQIKFIPDGGGTAPTALYDVTLVDANSLDVLGGIGANLSATAASMTRVAAPFFLDGTANMALSLIVANAGAAKGGTVVLWVGADGD